MSEVKSRLLSGNKSAARDESGPEEVMTMPVLVLWMTRIMTMIQMMMIMMILKMMMMMKMILKMVLMMGPEINKNSCNGIQNDTHMYVYDCVDNDDNDNAVLTMITMTNAMTIAVTMTMFDL